MIDRRTHLQWWENHKQSLRHAAGIPDGNLAPWAASPRIFWNILDSIVTKSTAMESKHRREPRRIRSHLRAPVAGHSQEILPRIFSKNLVRWRHRERDGRREGGKRGEGEGKGEINEIPWWIEARGCCLNQRPCFSFISAVVSFSHFLT